MLRQSILCLFAYLSFSSCFCYSSCILLIFLYTRFLLDILLLDYFLSLKSLLDFLLILGLGDLVCDPVEYRDALLLSLYGLVSIIIIFIDNAK
jgi:hypothetical protein